METWMLNGVLIGLAVFGGILLYGKSLHKKNQKNGLADK